jgi:hypothetical protein
MVTVTVSDAEILQAVQDVVKAQQVYGEAAKNLWTAQEAALAAKFALERVKIDLENLIHQLHGAPAGPPPTG